MEQDPQSHRNRPLVLGLDVVPHCSPWNGDIEIAQIGIKELSNKGPTCACRAPRISGVKPLWRTENTRDQNTEQGQGSSERHCNIHSIQGLGLKPKNVYRCTVITFLRNNQPLHVTAPSRLSHPPGDPSRFRLQEAIVWRCTTI